MAAPTVVPILDQAGLYKDISENSMYQVFERALESSDRPVTSPSAVGVTVVGISDDPPPPPFPDPGDPCSNDGQSHDESSCSSLCWSGNKGRTGSPYHQPPPSYEETTRSDAAAASRAMNGGQSPLSMNTPTLAASAAAVPTSPPQGPVILHKSSKALYRAVAAQWGIACKMTDHCRCVDCQSHYFDCDYDLSEHDKTDGGLAAGTPIFLQEAVLHGTACSIL